MTWFQAHNFFDSFRPVYVVAKFFHVHFETVDFQEHTVRRTLTDQVRFVLSTLMDFTFLIRSVPANIPYLHLTESVLVNVGNYLGLILLVMLTYTLPLWNHYKTKEIFLLCTSIKDCDRELRKLGIFIDHRKHRIVSTMDIVASMCISVIITLNGLSVRSNKAFDHDKYTKLETLVAIFRLATNFSVFISYTRMTLMSINGRLVKLQKFIAATASLQTSDGPSRTCRTIRSVAAVHDQLCEIIHMFNNCYSVQTMYAVIIASSASVFVVFGLIHAYASNASDVTMQMAWTNMLYGLFYMLMFMMMVQSASVVGVNSKRMAFTVHKAICYTPYDRQIFEELGRFSLQLEQHAPKISCGFFDFDWALFYSAAGTFTTYLIILLQFDLGNLNFHRD